MSNRKIVLKENPTIRIREKMSMQKFSQLE